MTKIRVLWDYKLKITETSLYFYLQVGIRLTAGVFDIQTDFPALEGELDISAGNSICQLVPSIYEKELEFDPIVFPGLNFSLGDWCSDLLGDSWCRWTSGRIVIQMPRIPLSSILMCDYLQL
jgi:hypothetical protein